MTQASPKVLPGFAANGLVWLVLLRMRPALLICGFKMAHAMACGKWHPLWGEVCMQFMPLNYPTKSSLYSPVDGGTSSSKALGGICFGDYITRKNIGHNTYYMSICIEDAFIICETFVDYYESQPS